MAPAAIRASAKLIEEGKILAQEAKAAREAERLAQAAKAAGTSRSAAAAGNAAGSVANAGSYGGPLTTAGDGSKAVGRGSATANYSTKYGLSEIEANKALNTSSKTGGTWDLLDKRLNAWDKIEGLYPNQFAENPVYNKNLITSVGGGGGGPRESFKMVPDIAPSPDLPRGQAAGLQPLEIVKPVPTVPPKPSGLEYVTNLFKDMMDSKIARGAGTVMRYAGPPAAVADIASEGMNLYQQSQKPSEQRDYGEMALSGLGALAGGVGLAATSPAWAIPAGLTSAGIMGYRYMKDREAAEQARQRMSGQPMR
jgi:hypothetical protein